MIFSSVPAAQSLVSSWSLMAISTSSTTRSACVSARIAQPTTPRE
jgi:hypothetical protein